MIQLLDENVDEENKKILNFLQDNLDRCKKRFTNDTNIVHDSRGHLGRSVAVSRLNSSEQDLPLIHQQ